jgi:uncharacterized protein YecE (DUF72 family)
MYVAQLRAGVQEETVARIRVGLSGWAYPEMRGEFYPRGLPHKEELAFASRQFNSIEINGSFYSLLRPHNYEHYQRVTPRNFRFMVKGSRFITHMKSLREVEVPLANFFASGVLMLREKLDGVLWQLPARRRFDAGRIEAFLRLLPRDTEAASSLARRHDERVAGRSWTRTDKPRRIRHAIEVRNESFFVPEFARIARDTGTAIAVSDAADWPLVEEVTTDFVYVRLHGKPNTYASAYGRAALARWAERIRAWNDGREPAEAKRISSLPVPHRKRDVYVYLDNDSLGHAPADARMLARLLGLAEPEKLEPQREPEGGRRSAAVRASARTSARSGMRTRSPRSGRVSE